jgi:hypothetical protein
MRDYSVESFEPRVNWCKWSYSVDLLVCYIENDLVLTRKRDQIPALIINSTTNCVRDDWLDVRSNYYVRCPIVLPSQWQTWSPAIGVIPHSSLCVRHTIYQRRFPVTFPLKVSCRQPALNFQSILTLDYTQLYSDIYVHLYYRYICWPSVTQLSIQNVYMNSTLPLPQYIHLYSSHRVVG